MSKTARTTYGPLSPDELSKYIDELVEVASREMVEATKRYEIYRLASEGLQQEIAEGKGLARIDLRIEPPHIPHDAK